MRPAGPGVVLTALTLASAAPAAAQSQPGFDCNLLGPDYPCDPYLLYPPGQNLQFTIRSGEPPGSRRQGAINTLRELFARIRSCWRPPALEEAKHGMELSVRFSFKRDGNLLGEPRFTYVSRAATPEQRDVYRRAVLDSLRRCTPLSFTAGLGGAIAGRPIVVRYIENRRARRSGIEP